MSNSATATLDKPVETAKKQKPVKTKMPWGRALKQHYWLYLMLVPGVLWMLIFCYLPMGGLVMAFENFNPYAGSGGLISALLESEKVGWKNFQTLFVGTDFMKLLKNTLNISVWNLLIAFPAPIVFALILNELRLMWFKRVSQTLVYIPHFVSMVIVYALTSQLFNAQDGFIYKMIESIVGVGNAPNIMGSPKYFVPVLIGQTLWKETGYGTIIYLAALASVDPQLYEAARIDGAGRWNLMWHVTLPGIRSTVVIMLIMKVGAILNTGYEQIFLLQNATNESVSEVFDTYVYNKGVRSGQYSLATTAGLFKSVVSLILVLSANKCAKLLGESGLY